MAEIRRILEGKRDWIEKTLAKVRAREAAPKLTEAEIRELTALAKKKIPPLVVAWADVVGVTYGRITIRCQKTRWGSCSSKGNLNFNCLLMRTPDDIVDYVVVHELCHLKEMNHSPKFWAEVEKILPDYKDRRKWLKDHESEIMYDSL
jgi:predicted metal-dependent hydrolase